MRLQLDGGRSYDESIVRELQSRAIRYLDTRRQKHLSLRLPGARPEGHDDTLVTLAERAPSYGTENDPQDRALPGYVYALIVEPGDDKDALARVARDWEGPRGHTSLEMDDEVPPEPEMDLSLRRVSWVVVSCWSPWSSTCGST